MMPAPTDLSSPLVSPINSLSLRDSAGAPPTYGVSIPSCSLITAGSSCVGCTFIPPDCPELVTLALATVIAAAISLLTRVSSVLTVSSSVAFDVSCSFNAPMVASRSCPSLVQLIRLFSFSLCRAATLSRSSTPSVHSLASSMWDKSSASLCSATLFLNSFIASTVVSFTLVSYATWQSLLALLAAAAFLTPTSRVFNSHNCSPAS